MLRTLFFYLCFYPWTLLVIIVGLPLSFVSPDYLHNCGRLWGRVCLWLAGVKLQVRGSEHLPRDHSAVFISNHQSNFDILALFAGLPLQFRWMAKEELFRIPFFGLAMRRSGYIPIDRSDRRKSMRSMTAAAKRVKDGTSVIIYPEGTRTPDGRLLPFKKGGFLIALKAQVPIIPIAIRGSYQIMNKESLRFKPGTVLIDILPPIATAGLGNSDIDQVMEQVRQPIAQLVEGATIDDAA